MRQTSIPEENLSAKGMRIALVVSQYHDSIVNKLLSAAVELYTSLQGSEADLETFYVPGSFEIPLATQELAQTWRFDALVTLGVVIRGETNHYDLICNEVARALMQISLSTHIPIAFGLVTAENLEQAHARAGGVVGNKGEEAMRAAIKIVALLKSLKG